MRVLEGVKYQYEPSCGNPHQSVPETHVHEQNKEVFELYSNLALDLNDSSDTKRQELIQLVKQQLGICKNISGNVKADAACAATISYEAGKA